VSRFAGLTALVTGGSSGIGLAVVRRLTAEGARVVFCGRDEAKGRDAESQVRAEGGDARYLVCDVSDETQVRAAVEQALAWTGQLDIAVNSAGMSPKRAPLTETAEASYQAVFDANVKGTVWALKHELRAMTARKTGVIVNVASVLGIKAANLGHALYTASKHAVVGLTKTAALEGAPFGVRVNVVCPGVIDTPIHTTNAASLEQKRVLAALHPLGRLGTADEAASAIVYLCAPEAGFITGAVFTVDGAASL
jgi:NAD(P)-dependent dehydrogenase (short-subunit alcohol dehydrogenase family)